MTSSFAQGSTGCASQSSRCVAACLHGVRPSLPRRPRVIARPLAHRRVRLEAVVAGSELVFPVRRLAPDGLAAWKQVIERGYEGYVAKDEASAYEGGTTRRWLKVKQKDARLLNISGEQVR